MKLVTRTIALCIMLKYAHSQFDYNAYFNQQSPINSYQSIPQSNYLNNADLMPLFNSYIEPVECECACDTCYNSPKPCCLEYCTKCAQESNPSGYVFYPYPYIVVANGPNARPKQTANLKIDFPTTQTTTTTVAATTQQTTIATTENEIFTMDPEDVFRENYVNNLMYSKKPFNQDNDRIMLTALRRTKPRWMPKFGIVPIPDQLAEKLMFRIRHMKVLHPEKETVRRIESMYSRNER